MLANIVKKDEFFLRGLIFLFRVNGRAKIKHFQDHDTNNRKQRQLNGKSFGVNLACFIGNRSETEFPIAFLVKRHSKGHEERAIIRKFFSSVLFSHFSSVVFTWIHEQIVCHIEYSLNGNCETVKTTSNDLFPEFLEK